MPSLGCGSRNAAWTSSDRLPGEPRSCCHSGTAQRHTPRATPVTAHPRPTPCPCRRRTSIPRIGDRAHSPTVMGANARWAWAQREARNTTTGHHPSRPAAVAAEQNSAAAKGTSTAYGLSTRSSPIWPAIVHSPISAPAPTASAATGPPRSAAAMAATATLTSIRTRAPMNGPYRGSRCVGTDRSQNSSGPGSKTGCSSTSHARVFCPTAGEWVVRTSQARQERIASSRVGDHRRSRSRTTMAITGAQAGSVASSPNATQRGRRPDPGRREVPGRRCERPSGCSSPPRSPGPPSPGPPSPGLPADGSPSASRGRPTGGSSRCRPAAPGAARSDTR